MGYAPVTIGFQGHCELRQDLSDHALRLALHVPDDAQIEESFLLELGNVSGDIHLDLRIGRGSRITLFHQLTSAKDAASSSSHHTNIQLADGAELRYVVLQDLDPTDTVRYSQEVRLHQGAACSLTNVTLGGKVVDHAFRSELVGSHAVSTLEWMFYAKNTEKMTLSARNVFDASMGGGEITMRGIAEDKAHALCNGLIDIGVQGGGTNTYLTQEVLMLDKTSKVDAIPGLEIKTNDVKASHSATVARITEEDLFYFGARGISESEARKLFVRGFLGSITEGIEQENIQGAVVEAIEKKMQR